MNRLRSFLTSRQTFSPRSFLPYFMAVFPPLLFGAFWHSQDKAYPTLDAACYAYSVMPAVAALKSGGWTSLSGLYWVRGWKTTLHPALLAPFLLVFGDSRLGLAIACFNLIVYFVLLTYVVRFMRRYMADAAMVPAVWIIGTLPWVLVSVYTFSSELSLMASAMAALYYMVENDSFASTWRSALLGFWLAMAFCAQPYVALSTVGLAYTYFAIRACRTGYLHRWDIVAAIGMTGFVFAPWLYDPSKKSGALVLCGLLFVWTAVVAATQWLRLKGALSKNFLLTHTLFLSLFLLWFAPFYEKLFYWGFSCTYGEGVQGMGLLQHPGIDFFRDLFQTQGSGVVVLLVILAATGCVARWISGKSLPADLKQLGIISGLMLSTILVAMTTYNPDTRYHFLGSLFFYIFLMILIAGHGSPGPKKLKIAFLLLLTLGQGWWVANSFSGTLDRHPLARYFWNTTTYGNSYPYYFSPSADTGGMHLLLKKTSGVIDLTRPVKIIPFLANVNGSPDLDTNGTCLVSLVMGNRASFELPWDWKQWSSVDWERDDFQWGLTNADYILVGILKKNAPTYWWHFNFMAEKIIRHWKENNLKDYGLKLLANIPIDELDGNLLIFKVNKK